MITIKPIKLTPKRLSSLTATIIILITLLILILVSLFLYKNFYQTITQTKQIMILREKVAVDTVNMEKFNIIMDKITKKTLPHELTTVISPFR
ncbi:MAG: hypothetical protein PHF50_04685 [Patescibacteria group bacterium]|nr:hypothetical protein [Patescibacteria group bacterium]